MSQLEKVSTCPHCGAPMYLPPQTDWAGGVPPQVMRTCTCAVRFSNPMLPSMFLVSDGPPPTPKSTA